VGAFEGLVVIATVGSGVVGLEGAAVVGAVGARVGAAVCWHVFSFESQTQTVFLLHDLWCL